jgi:hypothetical protein
MFKDGEKSCEIFLGMCGRGDARIWRPDARRDRRARKGRLRTKRLSSGLSVPLAMACRSTRQILQYRALGLRHGRRPASLSSLTRLQSADSVQAIVMRRAKALSAAAVDPGLAPVRQPASGAFLRLGGACRRGVTVRFYVWLRIFLIARHDSAVAAGEWEHTLARLTP